MGFLQRMKEKLTGKKDEQLDEQLVETTDADAIEAEAEKKDDHVDEVVEAVEVVEPIEATPVIDDEVVETSKLDEAVDELPAIVEEEEKTEQEIEKKRSWFSPAAITEKFKHGLEKTRNSFSSKVNDLVARYRTVDEEFFEELEELLLQADVGFETVMQLIEELELEVKRKNIKSTDGIQAVISEKLVEIY